MTDERRKYFNTLSVVELATRLDEVLTELAEITNTKESAISILAEYADCGSADLGCIFDMEKNFEGTIERAFDLAKEIDGDEAKPGFGHFVMAVKYQAIDDVEGDVKELLEVFGLDADDIWDDIYQSLSDMVIDDNYCAWGGIATYGYGKLFHEAQDAFVDWLVTGDDKHKERFLVEVKTQFVTFSNDEDEEYDTSDHGEDMSEEESE